jgi:hypothetical protein
LNFMAKSRLEILRHREPEPPAPTMVRAARQ